MADNERDLMAETPNQRRRETTDDQNVERIPSSADREEEHDRIRSSNDRDQELEREGNTSGHNRGYDKAVRGDSEAPTDPDSAFSDVDRDDTVDE